MKKLSLIILLGIAFVVAGCAAQGTQNYTEPFERDTENQITVPTPFNETWDRLVKNLSADFFSINNIEKASRIINVSFSTQDPGQFVDCGSSRRGYTSPGGVTQSYIYET